MKDVDDFSRQEEMSASNRADELFDGFSGPNLPNLYFPDSYVCQAEPLPNSDPKAELNHDNNSGMTTLYLENEHLTSFRLSEFNLNGTSNGFVYFRRLFNEALIRDGNDMHSDQVRVSKVAGAAWQSTTAAIKQIYNDFNRNLRSSSSAVDPSRNVTCPHCHNPFVIVLSDLPKPKQRKPQRKQRRRPRGQNT